MRASSLLEPATASFVSLLYRSAFFALARLPSAISAAQFTPVALPDLDIGPLGRTSLTGNFDAINLYQFEEQRPKHVLPNGSRPHSLLSTLPNGALASVALSDADILSLCPLRADDGTITSVVVGGNFTSLAGVETHGIALVDAKDFSKVTPISGLSGQVFALLCDEASGNVYVGGAFKQSESQNAIMWSPKSGFSSLPFAGFNGPVTAIAKTSDGHVIFGGSFDGLGNATTPALKDQQVVNLETASITSGSASSDPRNAICKQGKTGDAANPWLLPDNSPGFLRAEMKFGFQPTKLRLRNALSDGRGTKTFLFRAVPDNGILNMTYIDPATGNTMACDARCPLSNDLSEASRDFKFVNVVGMNGFQIEVSEWYGAGGGFDSVELFQDDIYIHAVDGFNEPTCAGIASRSQASATGNWAITPSHQSSSEYLTANVASTDQTPTSVTFEPDIKQSGNYSVLVFTPGCIPDNTCPKRGIVNVTATLSPDSDKQIQTFLAQTNNFDKYDEIHLGYVDASSHKFRPSVKLAPKTGQQDVTVVASRVRFQLISSTGGLNGLFEFDPTTKEVNLDFSKSSINKAGTDFNPEASITSLASRDDTIFVGGAFSGPSSENIMLLSKGKLSSLPGGGLNSQVNAMLLLDDTLFVGGNFSATSANSEGGDNENRLNNVALLSLSSRAWSPLGAGVDGHVEYIVQFSVNLTENQPEIAVGISGNFTHTLPFEDNRSGPAQGFAVWVPSRKNWLQNLDVSHHVFTGELTATITDRNVTTLLAGNLVSKGLAAHDAVALMHNDGLGLQSLRTKIQPTAAKSSLQRRVTSSQNVSGVVAGLFYNGSGRNLTILGGHFVAIGENDTVIENLLFLDGSNKNAVTGAGPGIDAESNFLAMALREDTLFAGGIVKGHVSSSNVHGLITYDLKSAKYASSQPPALEGDNVVVNSIAPRPGSDDVFIGGQFESAGGLPCSSVCNFQPTSNRWTGLGDDIRGVVSVLQWATKDKLIAAGEFTVGNNATTLAIYNAVSRTWSSVDGASSKDVIAGPITAFGLSREDGSRFWVAGKSADGSPFLAFYNGSKFRSPGPILGKESTIFGIQVIGLRKEHDETEMLDKDQVLLITGQLEIPDFGNASGALYNGTTLTPFVLASMTDGQPGIVTELFSENKNTFRGGRRPHSRGIVILVSFCIALGCVFLIVLIGIILNRIQRHRQGYVTAPRGTDRRPDLQRVPPEHLLDSLRQRASGAPVM
ncbi:conserved hypothetical protein [Histoplasma capsulatum G186AR]|uniref:Cellular morphogenesis protein n=2 Tax=Ajellomyces capsulatus TaxID=5037 RepID=C0NBS0_AJECG|nr:uncharacterized protein HCBG_00566 [Histoplasma capsulatum G186AR]EEH11111.1 conserved hypothetical protein [Histoplasma capsulatum G186AR]KAG5303036.1 cellular morphogenesis protein [Histoplasma capsulatum]QSS71564.1 cellular morphogenesis protein [Histoplasma capsulatum G186AR]